MARIAMATRGRKAGFRMSDEHRTKIANSRILGNLIKFAEGDDEVITKAQADIGLGLLKKVMPDLTYTEVAGDPDNPIKTEEVGNGSAKLLAYLENIAERSGTSGDPSGE